MSVRSNGDLDMGGTLVFGQLTLGEVVLTCPQEVLCMDLPKFNWAETGLNTKSGDWISDTSASARFATVPNNHPTVAPPRHLIIPCISLASSPSHKYDSYM
ncbi:unnamed protein product [Staurois parvus]|uniref:Uncharacterized protein n=1 Tax=Staurois parvus TaxID=386267 RepID=A0ABN9B0N5_9NEOB|nr:unnamed protein product [Staurois parvus]